MPKMFLESNFEMNLWTVGEKCAQQSPLAVKLSSDKLPPFERRKFSDPHLCESGSRNEVGHTCSCTFYFMLEGNCCLCMVINLVSVCLPLVCYLSQFLNRTCALLAIQLALRKSFSGPPTDTEIHK